MPKNILREKLRKGEPTIGTHIHAVWTGVTELIGYSGVFDYVEFTSTYAPYDLHDLDNIARAAELTGMSTMIKIDQEPRVYLAERAIAAGFHSVLFADIRTVEDAENAVKAVRSEPKGINGIGLYRSVGYVFSTVSIPEFVKACDDVVIALMIEKKSAVENLEEILSVDGIDMVQFGPADYSLSIGHPGELNHPKVREAELKTIKTALRMGVTPRAEIESPEEAERYIELGVRDFCIGTDMSILYNWCRENGGELRRILSKV